jgi:uncharacterized membrane protein
MERTTHPEAGGIPQNRTKTIVLTALLAALACVATMVIPIPSPTGGYLNPGDAVVLLGAYLLGPLYGAVAAGVGSMLADLLAGYALYAPATLVIKAAMALLAALLYRRLKRSTGGVLLCGFVGELPMVAGYWLYDAFLLHSFSGSLAGVPSNLAQAAFGIAASTLLALALRKSAYVRREFPLL